MKHKLKNKPIKMKYKIHKKVKKFLGYSFLFVASLFVMASMVSNTPSRLHMAAGEPTTGSVTINVPVDNAQYIILNNETDKLLMRHVGGTETFDLPANQYRVEFVKVFGHTVPKSQTFELNIGDSVTVDGYYEPVCGTPILSVKVFPSNAEYTVYNIQNEVMLKASGSDIFDLPPGKYWAEFAEMPGFASPGKIRFILADHTITTVNAVYDRK